MGADAVPDAKSAPFNQTAEPHHMHFVRHGEYLAASRITGPRHNLLQLRLGVGEQHEPICECLPPQGACNHEPLVEAVIVASVLEGTSEANRRFGTSHVVTHIRYARNDTKPEVVYGLLALKILEQLHVGGTFVEGSNTI